MSEKTDYVKQILTESPRYPVAVIKALKVFKKLHRFTESPDTFTQDMATRLEGMQTLVDQLSESYHISGITVASAQLRPGGHSYNSFYDHNRRKITMVGKLSILTLLHEFGHALHFHNGATTGQGLPVFPTSEQIEMENQRRENCEHIARVWSINLFKEVYPRAFDNLHNPEGHILTVENPNISEVTAVQTAAASALLTAQEQCRAADAGDHSSTFVFPLTPGTSEERG